MAKIITTFLLLVISNYACADDQEVGQALALVEKGESAYAEGKYEEAAQLYLASMQIRGTVRAASNLCNLFLYGQGVPQNYKKAMELCEAAAAGRVAGRVGQALLRKTKNSNRRLRVRH